MQEMIQSQNALCSSPLVPLPSDLEDAVGHRYGWSPLPPKGERGCVGWPWRGSGGVVRVGAIRGLGPSTPGGAGRTRTL